MIHELLRYRVRVTDVKTVEQGIEDLLAAVAEHEPATGYEAYRAADRTTFVHLADFPDEAARDRHRLAPHTRQFLELLAPRCVEEPEWVELHRVGGA